MVEIYECTGALFDAPYFHNSSWTLLAQLTASLADNTAPASIHDWFVACRRPAVARSKIDQGCIFAVFIRCA